MAVGRFQVMATLQAARAYVLGQSLESAKSFGLNRAIFYAAAKKGFGRKEPTPPKELVLFKKILDEEKAEKIRQSFKVYHLGDEMAYGVEIDGQPRYVIGNEIQAPEDFAKQIESRFAGKFDQAWKEAVKLCQEVDRGVLLSQRYFYENLYKPLRDELARKWTQMVAGL
ncbi:MAG: hypothetical protein ONB05_07040 [candidate division KSB1 bacterium]|nr:hypothetical protein [candidate division KSB1 bacterium]